MKITRSDGRERAAGRGDAGRPADAPCLAVSIACLLAVVLAATAAWEPAPGSAPAARGPAAGAAPAPRAPAATPAPGPVFAVQRGALGGLTAIGGRLAWNGVHAGMERPAVAARLGGALPPAVPHPAGWCGEHESRVERPEGDLILAFDGPGEGARLTSITVVVPGAEAAAGDRAAPARVFQTASGERIAVEPGVGLTFGDVCLG